MTAEPEVRRTLSEAAARQLANATKTRPQWSGIASGASHPHDDPRRDDLHTIERQAGQLRAAGIDIVDVDVQVHLGAGLPNFTVVGLPDKTWGERVHAVIVPRDDAEGTSAEEIVAWARARMAAYKVPKAIEFVAALPRSGELSPQRTHLCGEVAVLRLQPLQAIQYQLASVVTPVPWRVRSRTMCRSAAFAPRCITGTRANSPR